MYSNNSILFSVFLILSMIPTQIYCQISGKIVDGHNGEFITHANIILKNDSSIHFTNEKGNFIIEQNVLNERISIKAIGYKDIDIIVNHPWKDTLIMMVPIAYTLDMVLISEDHAKHEHYLSSIHLNEQYFNKNQAGTVSQALQKIAGLQSMDMGPGIGKPVIRGLHGNRIIVNKDYIKQEGHQWGSDHGLEIDPFDVQRVEIIKGPSSILYGSDGLGGVVNILPDALPQENTTTVKLRTLYKTNNNHTGSSLYAASSIGKWFAIVRISIQEYEDYRVPADRFTYNGFELPIYNRQIKNTAGSERSFKLVTGRRTSKMVNRLSYSEYNLRAGIFTGAIGTPRFYSVEDDGDPSNIENPFQEVKHRRLVYNHISFQKSGHWALNVGLQSNDRKEHSYQDAHSTIDFINMDTIALQLRLHTGHIDAHWDRELWENSRIIFGTNSLIQKNRRSGFDFLFPDFDLWRTGVFGLYEYKPHSNKSWSAGLRYDLANTTIESFRLRRLDRQQQVLMDEVIPEYQKISSNWAGSLGYQYSWSDKFLSRFSLGKSFRIPYPNELSSNGIHHGYFRHEIGNQNLNSEKGYQLDLGTDYKSSQFSAQVSAYFNYFDSYIYLRPTANFSRLPEGGLQFEYTQHNAIFSGIEIEYRWRINKNLNVSQAFDFVHSYNRDTGLALPFTPPASLLTEIEWKITKKKWDLGLQFSHQFVAANGPARVDRNELTTPSYHLIHGSISIENKGVEGLIFQIQVNNLLNTAYLNHLSRYRLLNLPEQGRNITFSILIPFHWKHKQG
jgi:iron complex outermembrane recepter protein